MGGKDPMRYVRGKCIVCGNGPVMACTDLCGPCNHGTADALDDWMDNFDDEGEDAAPQSRKPRRKGRARRLMVKLLKENPKGIRAVDLELAFLTASPGTNAKQVPEILKALQRRNRIRVTPTGVVHLVQPQTAGGGA